MAQVPGGPVNQVVLLNSIWIGRKLRLQMYPPAPSKRLFMGQKILASKRWYGINISIYSHEFNKQTSPLSNGSTQMSPQKNQWSWKMWKNLRGLEADAEGSTKMSELGGSQMVRGTQTPGFRGNFFRNTWHFPKMEVMEELAGILEIYLTSSLLYVIVINDTTFWRLLVNRVTQCWKLMPLLLLDQLGGGAHLLRGFYSGDCVEAKIDSGT